MLPNFAELADSSIRINVSALGFLHIRLISDSHTATQFGDDFVMPEACPIMSLAKTDCSQVPDFLALPLTRRLTNIEAITKGMARLPPPAR